jgi:hypothetical protein
MDELLLDGHRHPDGFAAVPGAMGRTQSGLPRAGPRRAGITTIESVCASRARSSRVAFNYLKRKPLADPTQDRWIEPRLGPDPANAKSAVFDLGRKTIVDCAHVHVERLGTYPVLFSKVFKEFEDRTGHKYDYRYWAERENFFLREFLKRQNEFTHVVQARHLISENEAAKQVLTRDAGITIADWLRVKPRYADTDTLSHPFQRSDAFLRMLRACLVALKQIHEHRIVHCDIKEDNICIPYAPNPFPAAGGRFTSSTRT